MRVLKRAIVTEELVALTGDFLSAIVLHQMIYWTERMSDVDEYIHEERQRNPDTELEPTHGWIYKSAEELRDEIMATVTAKTVANKLAQLCEQGWLQRRRNPYFKMDRTWQYRCNLQKIERDLNTLGYTLATVMKRYYPLVFEDRSDSSPQDNSSENDSAIAMHIHATTTLKPSTKETASNAKDANFQCIGNDFRWKGNSFQCSGNSFQTIPEITTENTAENVLRASSSDGVRADTAVIQDDCLQEKAVTIETPHTTEDHNFLRAASNDGCIGEDVLPEKTASRDGELQEVSVARKKGNAFTGNTTFSGESITNNKELSTSERNRTPRRSSVSNPQLTASIPGGVKRERKREAFIVSEEKLGGKSVTAGEMQKGESPHETHRSSAAPRLPAPSSDDELPFPVSVDEQIAERYKERIKAALEAHDTTREALQRAIEDAFHIAPQWHWKVNVQAVDRLLREFRATPQDIYRFAEWWNENDWRGKKGQPPRVPDIVENWPRMNAEKVWRL